MTQLYYYVIQETQLDGTLRVPQCSKLLLREKSISKVCSLKRLQTQSMGSRGLIKKTRCLKKSPEESIDLLLHLLSGCTDRSSNRHKNGQSETR